MKPVMEDYQIRQLNAIPDFEIKQMKSKTFEQFH